MMKPRWFLPGYQPPLLMLLSVLASCGLILAGAPQPLRLVAALWMVAFGPGNAVVRLLRFNDAITNLTLSIALSLALTTCVSLLMIYTSTWSLIDGMLSLAAIAFIASTLELKLVRNDQALPPEPVKEVEP